VIVVRITPTVSADSDHRNRHLPHPRRLILGALLAKAGGRVVEHWAVRDGYGMLEQINQAGT
jgi:hypothetical protein